MPMPVRWLVPRVPVALDIATHEELEAFEVARQLEAALRRDHGLDAFVSTEDDCVLLPPPYEVRLDGRTLRGDEHERYASAVLGAAATLPVREIRFHLELMLPLRWDAFDARVWSQLDALHASLPGWLAPGDRPRWFGRDERKGPCLWASVEPPGLHVTGRLDASRFDDWYTRLLAGLAGLPMRDA